MPDDIPHFQIPLNLPHAGHIARRILSLLDTPGQSGTAARLADLLAPYFNSGESPRTPVAARVSDQAAVLGRQLVADIKRDNLGHDRLGQCVRNLFECLELGREGAVIALRADESPRSLQRPA